MNRILIALLCLAFVSCDKPVTERQEAATVTATIHKVTLLDTVKILVNHLPISSTDVTTFTGTISWGDGNTTTFTNPAQASLDVKHGYAALGQFQIKITFDKPNAVDGYNLMFSGNDKTDTLLSLTGLAGIPNLRVIILQDDKLKDLDITGNNKIERLWLSGNRLTNATVNSLLTHMDSYTAFNLTPSPELHLNGQTPASPPSNTGLVAKQSLLSKGCTVITD